VFESLRPDHNQTLTAALAAVCLTNCQVSNSVMLDDAQEALLIDLVEADRRVPREKRESFLAIRVMSTDFAGAQILHAGWRDKERCVPIVDLEELASIGLLRSRSGGSRHDTWYSVTSAGVEQYTRIKKAQGQPIERVQRQVRGYVTSAQFQTRHAAAFKKWQEAEELLWQDDSERLFTTIGHLCREAMQEFAASLLRHERIPASQLEPAKTVDRIRLFMHERKAQLGDSVSAFLDALVVLWGTVSDLAQRQEHDSQREGKPLVWEDGRLLVFHVNGRDVRDRRGRALRIRGTATLRP
jgi:hypothetical protein